MRTAAPLLALLLLAAPAAAATSVCTAHFDAVPASAESGGTYTCSDCDASCDADGVAKPNKSCAFHLRVCLGGDCSNDALRGMHVHGRCGAVKLRPHGATADPMCGPFADVVVKLRKKGKKAGSCTVSVTDGRAPRRKLKLVCMPQTAAECPTSTTTTTAASVTTTTSPWTKLNPPFSGNQRIWEFAVSSDGQHVVYEANQDSNSRELYTVPIGGGTPVKLNGTPMKGSIQGFAITPDASRVVYVADQDTLYKKEIYSVPTAGGTPTKLNGAMPSGADGVASQFQYAFLITPDGTKVVYRADETVAGRPEIFIVPVAGGSSPTKLNAVPVSGGYLDTFFVSPNNQRVVYTGSQDTPGTIEVYSVLENGTSRVKLNPALVSGGNVDFTPVISPDSSRVVYSADQTTLNKTELYSAPIGTAASGSKISGVIQASGDVSSTFYITPNSQRVIYKADATTSQYEIFSVGITGGTVTKLNGTLNVNSVGVSSFLLSPDGSRVVYLADQVTSEVYELWSVVPSGGTATLINGTLVANGGVADGFLATPDSAHILYLATETVANREDLFVTPLVGPGSQAKQLSVPKLPTGEVANLFDGVQLNHDRTKVLYLANSDDLTKRELFVVPLAGGTPVRLSNVQPSPGFISSFAPSPTADIAVYTGDQDTTNVVELYVTHF